MIRTKNKISQYLLLLAAVMGLFSCSDHKIVKAEAIGSTAVYPPPFTVLLDTCPPPKITRLKDVPKPKLILLPGNSVHPNKISMTMDGDNTQPNALFTNFNTEHGLSIPFMRGAFMDKKGRLWFGSNGGGVTRYDGTEFTTMLDGTAINGIAEDIRGWIWFATSAEGAICYDGVKFTTYTTKDGLADNLIFNIFSAKDGGLWFATLNGASRFDGSRFVTKNFSNDPLANNVNMITEDKMGNLWFILYGGGLCRYDGREYRFYTSKDGLPTHEMLSMLEDSKGNFWFGSFEQGISRFDGTAFTTIRLDNKPEFNTVGDIEEDSNGDIWFATGGIGAIRYDGKEFTRFTTAQGLPSNVINNIVKDKHGNLWFATSNGVSRYQGKAFTAFTAKQGLPQNYITNITEDRLGNFWFGTVGSGLIRYDGEDFFALTTEHGLPSNFSTSTILDKSGNLWIGINGGGVCRFDGPQQLTRFTTEQGLAGDGISGMCLDSAGHLWIATYFSGVSRFDGKEFISYRKAQGLPYDGVNSLMTDSKGNLWFGILAGGVTRFDGKSFTTFTTAHGLAGNEVYGIEEDRFGNLWIATITGLSRYDGHTLLSFNSSDGLPDDVLVNITEDEAGNIWLGSNKGFCSLKFKTPPQGKSGGEIKGAGLFAIPNEALKSYELICTAYNEKTGYPVKDMIYTGSMKFKKYPFPRGRQNESGVLWASTGNARLIRFDPRSERKSSEPALPFLRNIRINQQAINWYELDKGKKDSALISRQEELVFGRKLLPVIRDSLHRKLGAIRFDSITPFYQVPMGLVLPFDHNHLTIDYGAIETNRNFMVRYQYILDGYDKEWNPVTEKLSASYGNIFEGSYTFRLKAMSPEGIWSDPISYTFKVLPPWWRTWWMYMLYSIATLSIIGTFIRWRINTLKKEKIILENKVASRTQELSKEKEKVEHTLIELKSTQAQLIQSEKMASLGELTAGIAHEIQNPLNFVNNFSEVNAELLAELKTAANKGDIEEVKAIADDVINNEEKINHHGKRADAIVKGMLQHSRSSSGIKVPTDINLLTDEYLRLSFHGLRARDKSFNADLVTDFDKSIPRISMVPQDIGRVILNLLNNAFYAAAGVSLPDHKPIVWITTKNCRDHVELSIRDNGAGIPEKIRDKIFQPFFTTKPTGQGTGLGLSLSYDIIKAHGGEIKVESTGGEGTTFVILLPF